MKSVRIKGVSKSLKEKWGSLLKRFMKDLKSRMKGWSASSMNSTLLRRMEVYEPQNFLLLLMKLASFSSEQEKLSLMVSIKGGRVLKFLKT